MSIFDMIGPVMIGPSSSHTAGAIKIGRFARRILNAKPVDAKIYLHGSFAKTYKGHGTDRAIVGGIMNFANDDERIKNSLEIAKEEGLCVTFTQTNLKGQHPNTAKIVLTSQSGDVHTVLASSLGGGMIKVCEIDDIDVSIKAQMHTLIVFHEDRPGVISKTTHLLSCFDINIANMRVFRATKGGEATMVIETDDKLPDEILGLIRKLDKVHRVLITEPI